VSNKNNLGFSKIAEKPLEISDVLIKFKASNHMKVCCFQNSLENLQSPRGYVQMHVISFLQLEAGAWSSQGLPTPPPASAALSRREGSPGGP
jgi:hypothetical protein